MLTDLCSTIDGMSEVAQLAVTGGLLVAYLWGRILGINTGRN